MMNTRPLTVGLALICAPLVWSGCSLPSSQPVVAQSQTNRMHTLEWGTIIATKEVVVAGDRTGLGGWGGAAVGSAAASPQDGRYGTTERVATAAGGVAGAIAGQAVEEAVTREAAQELTIELDSGRTVMIIQETPDGRFRQGDRVQVAHAPGSAVVRLAIN